MSGPKVVRIVTLEEVTDICQGHLARLDQAIQQWQNNMDKINEQDEDFYKGIVKCRENFNQMLAEERFLDIQKLVPIEIDHLAEDIEQRKKDKIEQKVQQRIENRQLKENAKTILKSIVDKNLSIPDDLDEKIQQIIKNNYQGNVNEVLNQAFLLLTPKQDNQLTDRQQALLDRMEIDNTKETFHDWLKQQGQVLQRDPRIVKVDNYLSELALENIEIYEVFTNRLSNIEQEAQQSRQNLLLDSLILDLSKVVKETKERNTLLNQLELVLAELRQTTANTLNIDMQALDKATVQELKKLINSCELQLTEIRQATIAAYRQQTILQGLASIGYEVREGMQTQWAKEGKLVVRNPATPGYGIELVGKAENSRFQIRAVRFTATENKQRDTDIETLWCGDFGKLQTWLAKQGNELLLEKSLPIGQVALKQVIEANESFQQEYTQTKYL